MIRGLTGLWYEKKKEKVDETGISEEFIPTALSDDTPE